MTDTLIPPADAPAPAEQPAAPVTDVTTQDAVEATQRVMEEAKPAAELEQAQNAQIEQGLKDMASETVTPPADLNPTAKIDAAPAEAPAPELPLPPLNQVGDQATTSEAVLPAPAATTPETPAPATPPASPEAPSL